MIWKNGMKKLSEWLRKKELSDSEKTIRGMIVIGGIFIVLTLFICFSPKKSDAPLQTKEPDYAMAQVMSCDFVKENLTTPATARFPWSSDAYRIIETQGRYKVESYVDSQNAFGAQIRKKFVVLMRYDPTDECWTLEKIDFY